MRLAMPPTGPRPARPDETTMDQAPPGGASRLLVLWPGGSQILTLPERGVLVVGRGAEADVCISDASVSRRHAQIHVGSELTLEDLGSANGTRVDGTPLSRGERRELVLGAIAELGSARIIAHYAPPAAGVASPMDRVFEVVERVAPSEISVILGGETGVGKEVIAERIHARSPRAAGPLVRLHCAALPENLLESELFGYERGAFTGATAAKPGLLESAGRGTVLLDEIGELPLNIQAKLLRALESREVHRLGALRPRPIDVRFIAASHRDLDVLAVMGSFRSDLLYRLNGITIVVPPLRARPMEIPDLTRTFIAEACARANQPVVDIDAAALALLSSYRWPGNVRELRNVVERAVLLSAGRPVEVEHVTFGKEGTVPTRAPMPPAPSMIPPPMPDSPSSPSASEGDAERERILDALARTAGNQTEAAKLLGMTRRMLIYRLDQLSVVRPRRGQTRTRE
jgi:two-component system, NtrC family, response regulator AtoC